VRPCIEVGAAHNLGRMKRILPSAALLIVAAWVGLVPPVSGQDTVPPVSGPQMVRLYGRILDAATAQPVYGASVRPGMGGRGHVTDTLGLFVLELPAADEYLLTAGQMGYQMAVITLPATAPAEFTTVLLEPNPMELEGLEVLVDRFARRRSFYPESVRVLDQAQLLRTPAVSAFDLLLAQVPQAWLCGTNSVCVPNRGRARTVEICVDQEPVWAGVIELERYSATDLYMVEVLDRGHSVRFYTMRFMERMMNSGKNLEPLSWGCPGADGP
jgi:hypothetical protein